MIANNLYRCGVASDPWADIRKHGTSYVCEPKEAAETFFREHEDPDGLGTEDGYHIVGVVHVMTGKRMQFSVQLSEGGVSATPLSL